MSKDKNPTEPARVESTAPEPEAAVEPGHTPDTLRQLADDELIELANRAAEAAHWKDVAARTQAELENTIKRLRREHQDAVTYGAGNLGKDLLQGMDNLARALESATHTKDFAALHEGVRLTHRMLTDALARHGITPIEAEGKPFDPALHEAILVDDNAEADNNSVTAELEKGWKMHERVLRASKVKVNKRAG